MNKKIIIVGGSGSGKDYLLKQLISRGLKYSPKFTSRPRRSEEVDGVNYNFITNDEFNSLNENNEIKVYQLFNIRGSLWSYGISKQNFDENEVFIMTPHEIKMLNEEDLSKSFIVYLDIDEDIRKERISSRNDNNDDVQRRIDADNRDFEGFDCFNARIDNPNFYCDDIYNMVY